MVSRLDKKKSLLLTLETRLDVILVRLYFCSTLFAARQLITHNKIRVNLNVVNLPGFTVRNGDIISIDDREAVTVSATAARLRLVDLVKSKMKHLTVAKRGGAQRVPPAALLRRSSLIFDRSASGGLTKEAVRLSAAVRPDFWRGPKGEAPNEAPNGAPNVDRDSGGQVIVSASGQQIIVSADDRRLLANRQNMDLFSTVRRRASTYVGPFVAIRERPFTGVGGLYHFEVNYKTFHAVLLYEPIQIHFPYKIDFDLLF